MKYLFDRKWRNATSTPSLKSSKNKKTHTLLNKQNLMLQDVLDTIFELPIT